MKERTPPRKPAANDTSRRPSRFPMAAAGAAVIVACFGYASWSLLQGRSGVAESADEGVALQVAGDLAPVPSPEEPIPTARLTLDDGVEPFSLPVVNAHLEVPARDDGSSTTSALSPAVTQLGFHPHSTAPRPTGAVGAWLTGTIEPVEPREPAAPAIR